MDNDSERKKEVSSLSPALKGLLVGSLSGTFSTILFQPLDLIKTKLQNKNITTTEKYPMISVVRTVLENERVFGLWKGMIPSILRTVPGVGIHFGSLSLLKASLFFDDSSAFQTLILGMMARSVAGTLLIPLSVIKTRFESGSFGYKGTASALSSIYKTEGLRGLKCGLAPTLIRDAPFSGLYLMFYTRFKSLVNYNDPHTEFSRSGIHFMCGLLGGLLASALTHPADVLKTKMQLKPQEHKSIFFLFFLIIREQGLSGLCVGIVPRMLRRSLMASFTWTLYERIMKQIGLV